MLADNLPSNAASAALFATYCCNCHAYSVCMQCLRACVPDTQSLHDSVCPPKSRMWQELHITPPNSPNAPNVQHGAASLGPLVADIPCADMLQTAANCGPFYCPSESIASTPKSAVPMPGQLELPVASHAKAAQYAQPCKRRARLGSADVKDHALVHITQEHIGRCSLARSAPSAVCGSRHCGPRRSMRSLGGVHCAAVIRRCSSQGRTQRAAHTFGPQSSDHAAQQPQPSSTRASAAQASQTLPSLACVQEWFHATGKRLAAQLITRTRGAWTEAAPPAPPSQRRAGLGGAGLIDHALVGVVHDGRHAGGLRILHLLQGLHAQRRRGIDMACVVPCGALTTVLGRTPTRPGHSLTGAARAQRM